MTERWVAENAIQDMESILKILDIDPGDLGGLYDETAYMLGHYKSKAKMVRDKAERSIDFYKWVLEETKSRETSDDFDADERLKVI